MAGLDGSELLTVLFAHSRFGQFALEALLPASFAWHWRGLINLADIRRWGGIGPFLKRIGWRGQGGRIQFQRLANRFIGSLYNSRAHALGDRFGQIRGRLPCDTRVF